MSYILTLTSHKIRFYGLLSCFVLIANIAYAQEQNRLYMGVGVGPSVSFNEVESDKPLPDRVSALQRAGVSFDFFLEYILTQHVSLQADIKTATLKTGIRYDDLVMERDAQGQVTGLKSGASIRRIAPAHVNVGVKLNSNLLRNRFILSVGAGVAYMFVKEPSASPTTSSAYGPDDEENLSATFIETRENTFGLLLNTNASVSYRVGKGNYLMLTASFNQGLVDIYKQESQVFDFQTAQGTESYQVSIINKGSYAALQLGYKMPLQNLPFLNNK